ncbi:splicing factor u2af-associated protein 2 [Rhodotorula toruloides]|uniref:Splicing factor u2af-associated protein 2 n=1 Tax=Rhodotorula toruloides TaxID=5286 RepID=A0A511KMB1_RHOTO|nr:splicing factor u2af-associated protein 2 [Rhodotorula toruloides]
MSSSSAFDNSFQWPVDLQQLVHSALYDTQTQSFVNSSCNTFFHPVKRPNGTWFVDRRTGPEGCWDRLPGAWRTYFEAVTDTDEREELLVRLSQGEAEGLPESLSAYLTSCRILSLNRTCSPVPVLSYPSASSSATRISCRAPTPAPLVRRERTEEEKLAKVNLKNALQAGKSPKKEHEVENLSRLVGDVQAEERLTHCIDVGSGRAHLSRALACPPLDLHVLAIDWSSTQIVGAERIDQLRADAFLAPDKGSLTHEVSSLDADGVQAALERWPPVDSYETCPPALLIALHACGDLTPNAMTAFIRAEKDAQRSGARAILVGCCYNMQTPSLFPLSRHFASLLASGRPMSRAHLRLTPQSPPTWHLTPGSTAAMYASTLKLAYRARFEAEMGAAGIGADHQRRVGRISECRSWEEYRERALKKAEGGLTSAQVQALRFGDGDEGADAEAERWATALFQLRVFWTLRSWLGPPLETLCVLDRFAYLCEGLREAAGSDEMRRRVEVVNIFDQATGSLRNVALVVR